MRHQIEVIGHIETDFKEKFGIPRQSGIIKELTGKIIFAKKYRNPDAIRGIEKFTHLWLLWQFSENVREDWDWSPTVRPPRLGGSEKKGVFATRSPFRPNNIGLSCVELEHVEIDKDKGPLIFVRGADLLDGTPIYDIKPYIPYTDAHPQATCSFAAADWERKLEVDFPESLLQQIVPSKQVSLIKVLEQDPRPAYKEDSDNEYGLKFADYDVKFVVKNKTLIVTGVEILKP